MKESKARYKITEELSLVGKPCFWVYKKRSALTLFFPKYSWKPEQVYNTFEEAERVVKAAIAYEDAAENPKQVRYF